MWHRAGRLDGMRGLNGWCDCGRHFPRRIRVNFHGGGPYRLAMASSEHQRLGMASNKHVRETKHDGQDARATQEESQHQPGGAFRPAFGRQRCKQQHQEQDEKHYQDHCHRCNLRS
jgi:hypothetical protein